MIFKILAKLSKRDFVDCRIAVTTSFFIFEGAMGLKGRGGGVLKVYLET